MLKQGHFLLSYVCNFECDHCFLYCSPSASGTFTAKQMTKVCDELAKIKSVDGVYFEGGEPFLFYPMLLEGIRIARSKGFKVGIVTNGYWATTPDDAKIWLEPIKELGLHHLSVSDDDFHYGEEENTAKFASRAAKRMGISTGTIAIEEPVVIENKEGDKEKGKAIIGGGAVFRGRAVEKLVKNLPTRSWRDFPECPYENLREPERIHLDPFGNVHLCQGLSMGNMWKTPLSRLVKNYDADSHPIAGPLADGGPSLLTKKMGVRHASSYVDACHLCYSTRKSLIDRYPEYLAPRQCYGL